MLKRFIGFLFAAALLVGFGILFYLNPSLVEFRLSAERAYTLPLPLLLLLSFLGGAVVVFLLALVRETQWTLADRRRRREERKREQQRTTLAAGRQLHWEGLPEQARSLLRRSRQAPEGLEASLLLAEAALDSDRPDEARAVIEEALTRHPDQPQLLALLANTDRRLGRIGVATVHLEKAVAVDPKSPRLLALLRDSYVSEGRWTDALRTEESLLATLRFPEQILREQGKVRGLRYQAALASNGDGSVIRELKALLAQYPAFIPAVISLGDALRRVGRDREAATVWMRAAASRPLPALLQRIESVYADLGRHKRMTALYRKLRKRSDSPVLLLRLARFLASQGRLDEAARELDAAGPEFEQIPEFHEIWGEIYQARGDVKPALAALRRTLEYNPLPAYACRGCGRREPEWVSRCPGCGQWDSLESIAVAAS